jgi:hypothetical protein
MKSHSPDLRGQRVRIAPADHLHHRQSGVVVDQQPCALKPALKPDCGCGYDDLIVELDDGTLTRIYEPEAERD